MGASRIDGSFLKPVPVDFEPVVQGETDTLLWTCADLPEGVTAAQAYWMVKRTLDAADSDALLLKNFTTVAIAGVGQITDDGAVTRVAGGFMTLSAADTTALPRGRWVHGLFVKCSDGEQRQAAVGAFPVRRGVPMAVVPPVGEPAVVIPTLLTPDLIVGEKHQVRVTVMDGYGNAVLNPAVSYSSSDSAAVSVDATGVLTVNIAHGGAAPITITARVTGALGDVIGTAVVRAWKRGQLVVDGNSISDWLTPGGAALRRQDMYWEAKLQLLFPDIDVVVTATSGITTPQLTARAAATVDVLYDPLRLFNDLLMWEIVNDRDLTVPQPTARDLADHVAAYMTPRGAVGWRRIIATLQAAAGSHADHETVRLATNAFIRAEYQTYAEAIWDLGNDAVWGLYGNGSTTGIWDTTLRQDLLHPTQYGHDLLCTNFRDNCLDPFMGNGAACTAIAIDPPTLTVAAGASSRVKAIPVKAGGARLFGKLPTWTSADETKMVASARGLITGHGAGTANALATLGAISAALPVVVTAAAYASSKVKTLVEKLDGDGFVRYVAIPKFTAPVLNGAAVASIPESRGIGLPALAQATGGLQPAYDAGTGLVSSDGTKELTTGDVALFDMERDHTIYVIGALDPTTAVNGFLVGMADAALSRSEGPIKDASGKVAIGGGYNGIVTDVTASATLRVIVFRSAGATTTGAVLNEARASDRKRPNDWSGNSGLSWFAPAAGWPGFRGKGSIAGVIILSRASIPQEDAIVAALASAEFGAGLL